MSRRQTIGLTTILTACLMLGLNTVANATPIGTGALAGGAPDTSTDGVNDQSRLNVDQGFTLTPTAGIYLGTTWEFNAGQTGSVTPFIAKETGADTFEILAVGSEVVVNSPGIQTGVTFGGSPFVVDGSTAIFAGITNPTVPGSQNPINQSNVGGNTTDHTNNDNGQIPDPVVVGGTVSGFSHANLTRSYHFAIEVEQIPEPSTLVLGLLALLGLMGTTLRRKRAR